MDQTETKTEVDKKVNTNNVLYFHGTTNDYRRCSDGYRYTVAGEYTTNGLVLGIAICSAQDQFVKKTGREKALERMYMRKVTPLTGVKGTFVNLGISVPEGEQIKFFTKFVSTFNVLPREVLMTLFHFPEKK